MKSTNRLLFLKVLQLKVVVVMDFLMNNILYVDSLMCLF